MEENTFYKGSYIIEICNADTGETLDKISIDNQLTLINQTVRTQMLLGTYTGGNEALQIQFFAFGTGTTPASVNDTQLVSEQFRKQVTQISNPSAGTVTSIVSLTASEANFTIKEIGVFCGASATSTPNSGTLLSRVNVNINKNSNITLNITRNDICTI